MDAEPRGISAFCVTAGQRPGAGRTAGAPTSTPKRTRRTRHSVASHVLRSPGAAGPIRPHPDVRRRDSDPSLHRSANRRRLACQALSSAIPPPRVAVGSRLSTQGHTSRTTIWSPNGSRAAAQNSERSSLAAPFVPTLPCPPIPYAAPTAPCAPSPVLSGPHAHRTPHACPSETHTMLSRRPEPRARPRVEGFEGPCSKWCGALMGEPTEVSEQSLCQCLTAPFLR